MVEADRALSQDDPETAAIVLERLRDEGIDMREGATITEMRRQDGGTGDRAGGWRDASPARTCWSPPAQGA